LHSLGVDLEAMEVSHISKLQVSSLGGNLLEQELPLGGFGISRFLLDHVVANIARINGVLIAENTKVNDVVFDGNEFIVNAAGLDYSAAVVCGCYGKRGNMDVKWKRSFTTTVKNKLNNYVGVKYHIQSDLPVDTIALHNFDSGYCGVAKIEDDKYCLCYLTTASNLQKSGGDIKVMEQEILGANCHLSKIWTSSKLLFETPVTISQISFDKKSQVEHHVLMVGDAAGMITPLCGNGMSMALHAGKIAAKLIDRFMQGLITRTEMEQQYTRNWKNVFGRRLMVGRYIQSLLTNGHFSSAFVNIAGKFPSLTRLLVKQTHGVTF
jgi:flavin-dependent dehydrogenase